MWKRCLDVEIEVSSGLKERKEREERCLDVKIEGSSVLEEREEWCPDVKSRARLG